MCGVLCVVGQMHIAQWDSTVAATAVAIEINQHSIVMETRKNLYQLETEGIATSAAMSSHALQQSSIDEKVAMGVVFSLFFSKYTKNRIKK